MPVWCCSVKDRGCTGGAVVEAVTAGRRNHRTCRETQSWAGLIAAQKSIDDLAAVLVRARAALGGVAVQISNHLEMAEMDLLSARDAIERLAGTWMISPRPVAMSAAPLRSSIALPGVSPAGSKYGLRRARAGLPTTDPTTPGSDGARATSR
jgi:hypothetical protein